MISDLLPCAHYVLKSATNDIEISLPAHHAFLSVEYTVVITTDECYSKQQGADMVKYIDKFNVVEWMAERGITGYLHRIDARKHLREAIIADKLLKPTVQADLLEKIEQEIAEIEREAQDRYNDWASDPLENGGRRD